MNLDRTVLESLRTELTDGIRRFERSKQMRPLYEAMRQNMAQTMGQVGEVMFEPELQVRISTLTLERSRRTHSERMQQQGETWSRNLERVRKRGAVLRELLEVLG